VSAFRGGDHTTKMRLEDMTDGREWIIYEYDGAPLDPSTAAPARLLLRGTRGGAGWRAVTPSPGVSSSRHEPLSGGCCSSVAKA
jgi:hypothetical protein